MYSSSSSAPTNWRRFITGRGGNGNNDDNDNKQPRVLQDSDRDNRMRNPNSNKNNKRHIDVSNKVSLHNNPAAPRERGRAEAMPNTLGASVGVTDIGCDIVEYGASVQTQDDQRRMIHVETQEIEASNVQTEKSIEQETRMEDRLQKDIGHAKMELRSLNQGALDQLDSAKMFSTLTENLNQEFQTEIVRSITPSSKSSEGNGASTGEHQTSEDSHPITPDGRTKGDETEGGESSPRLSNKDMLEEKNASADAILRRLKDHEKELRSIVTDTEDLEEKCRALQKSIRSQGLVASLERAREEIKKLEVKVQKDEDVAKTLNDEIQNLQESCGTKGQECTNLAKKLAETKQANAKEEEKLKQQLEVETVEVKRVEKEKEELELQIKDEQKEKEKLSKEMEDCEYYAKVKADYETAMATQSERKKALLARQLELKRELEEQKEKEKESLVRKQKAEEEASLAQAKKKEIADLDATVIEKAKEEMRRLAEQKVKLAGEISDASKKWEMDQAKEEEDLAAKRDALAKLKEQREQLESSLQAKKGEIEKEIEKQKELEKSHEDEIASHEALKEKFVGMYQEEKEAYASRYNDLYDHMSNKYLQKLNDLKLVYKTNKFKMEVFERAIKKLEEVEEIELSIGRK